VLTEAGSDYLAKVDSPRWLFWEKNPSHSRQGRASQRDPDRLVGQHGDPGGHTPPPRLHFEAPCLRIDLAMDRRSSRPHQGCDRRRYPVRKGGGFLRHSKTRRIKSSAHRRLAGLPETRWVPEDTERSVRTPMLIGVPGSNGVFSFEKKGRTVSVKVEAPLSGNISEAAVAGGVAGIGIVACSLWGCRAERNRARWCRSSRIGHGRRRCQRHFPGRMRSETCGARVRRTFRDGPQDQSVSPTGRRPQGDRVPRRGCPTPSCSRRPLATRCSRETLRAPRLTAEGLERSQVRAVRRPPRAGVEGKEQRPVHEQRFRRDLDAAVVPQSKALRAVARLERALGLSSRTGEIWFRLAESSSRRRQL
jgi:hypothetical protein